MKKSFPGLYEYVYSMVWIWGGSRRGRENPKHWGGQGVQYKMYRRLKTNWGGRGQKLGSTSKEKSPKMGKGG